MLSQLRDLLSPFTEIAKEIRILRELYELDLANREVPIRRVTEEPSKYDTEVTYSGEEDIPPNPIRDTARRLIAAWTGEDEDEGE
jgi:hypothetical protein